MTDTYQMNINLDDGKYTYQFQDGRQNVLRYGEPWRTLTGDKFVYAMACEIERLKLVLNELMKPNYAYAERVATTQLENQKLREALEHCKPLADYGRVGTKDVEQAEFQRWINEALQTPPNDSALRDWMYSQLEPRGEASDNGRRFGLYSVKGEVK